MIVITPTGCVGVGSSKAGSNAGLTAASANAAGRDESWTTFYGDANGDASLDFVTTRISADGVECFVALQQGDTFAEPGYSLLDSRCAESPWLAASLGVVFEQARPRLSCNRSCALTRRGRHHWPL